MPGDNKTKFAVFNCFDRTLFRNFKDASYFEIEELRALRKTRILLMASYNLQNKRVGILNSHGLWLDTYFAFVCRWLSVFP
jgi:GTPase SAR1 family protein